jgi:biotin-(acetyl-CoA carboxylase) ligase
MADAAEREVELPAGTIRLKWPNDLVAVVDRPGPDGHERVLKLGGVLGEGTGLGSDEPTIVVGIGVNAAWHPDRFPPELRATMTSLHEVTGGMPVDRGRLMEGFLDDVAIRVGRLGRGLFDAGEWANRQVTTGRTVALDTDEGLTLVPAVGVDTESGALLVGEPGSERSVLVGDVRHVRLGTA